MRNDEEKDELSMAEVEDLLILIRMKIDSISPYFHIQ